MPQIITIGDSSIDLFMKVDAADVIQGSGGRPEICFVHGTKIPVEHFETSVAGNAINVAVCCAKLNIESAVYTEIGADQNADRILKELENNGVSTDYVFKNLKSETDVHTVIVYQGERTIFSYHGDRTYDIKFKTPPKWLYYSSIGKNFESFHPKLIEYLAKNPDVGLACNPGTMQLKQGVEGLLDILKVLDILFVNKDEAELLTKTAGQHLKAQILHEKLQQLGPKLTVITDGEHGASGSNGTAFTEIPIYSDARPIVDRTGAGDAFAGGFMAAIIHGKNMKDALEWGAVEAGCNVKVSGSIDGLVSKKELDQILIELKAHND